MLNLNFNEYGLLPPGDYAMNFDMLRSSLLVVGNQNCDENWDSEWRLKLVNNSTFAPRK
jgi:hypothetical protein